MSATTSPRDLGGLGDREWSPTEGWTSVALLALMLVTLGLAVDQARWVGTTVADESRTGFLPIALLAGAVWGFIGAKSSLPALAVHAIGAVIGALLVIVFVADINSTARDLSVQLEALSASLDRFGVDLLVRRVRSSETAPFLLVTGCIAWATGAYAAFAVFRRHRPMDALVVTGLLLLANISLTFEWLIPHLVIFSAAALLLLVRANLDEQRTGWARRRIGDAGHVSGLFMRSGLTFVAVALAGAVVLTGVASSDPLAGVWRTYQSDIAGWGQQLNRIVGGLTAPARGPNALFTSSQTIQSLWQASNVIAYYATTSDGGPQYWRVATYDDFSGDTWNQTTRTAYRVDPGQPVLGASIREVPELHDRQEVTAVISAVQPAGDSLLAPDAPLAVDRPLSVVLSGEQGPYLTADLADGVREGDTYTVTSLVRRSDLTAGLTESKLRATSQAYPSWLKQYTAVTDGSIGETTLRVADEIVSSLGQEQPHAFDIAKAMQAYLRSDRFEYATDIRGRCQSGQVIDCFLREDMRMGFCQQFASAMVIMLRTQGIPARLAMGYLPGVRRASDGVWQIDRGAAHAWAEVYFVGEGWVRFDPTPGAPAIRERGSVETQLPIGEPVPTPSAGPGSSAIPGRTFGIEEPDDDRAEGGGPLPPLPGPPGGGTLAAILVGLLALGILIAAWSVRERRRPTPPPDVVYGGVARLARRFGYGPRPTQTAYEYAGALGEVIPAAREELELVARVKVETQYARRTPSPDVLLAVRRAYRRIRLRLLTLAFRRPRRRR